MEVGFKTNMFFDALCTGTGLQMNFFFRFQEFDLIESPQVKIFGSGPISYVTVIPTDRQLYGNYKCIATNSLGEAEHITQLREAFPPGPVAQVTINQH